MNRALAALMVIAAPSVAVAQEPGELKWKLVTGDVLVYDHVIEQHFKLSSDDSNFEYLQRIEASERLDVERTNLDGTYDVKVTVHRVRVTIDGRVVFDSDTPDQGDPQAAALFKQAVGQPQTFAMTSTGKLASKKTGTLKDQMQQSLSSGMIGGETSLPMAILAVPLPDAPVGVNRSWNVSAEEENESGCKMVSTSTYRFEGPSGAAQAIAGETTLRIEKGPATMKLRDGSGKQRAIFDAAGGVLKESDLDFTVALENQIEGKVIRVTNGMKSTTKLKERSVKK